MLQISVTSSGDEQAIRELLDLEYRITDLRPLALKIGDIVQTDNMAARMLGVDKDGQPFAPLAESTWATRMGMGPPLAPLEQSSRIISDLTITLVDVGVGAVDLIGDWPSMPFLTYHVTGTRHMPARDPVGVRAEGWAEIEIETDNYLQDVLRGVY